MKRAVMLLSLFFVWSLPACSSPKIMKIPDTLAIKDYAPETGSGKKADVVERKDDFNTLDKEQTYSLSVREADLRNVLLLLSKKSGVTIIIDEDVAGKVTADFRDKSIREILAAILKPAGYAVFVDNGLVRVGRAQLVSRTFYMNYIKDKRSSTSTMNAAISESGMTGYIPTTSSINLNLSSGTTGAVTPGTTSSSQQGNVTVQTSGVSDFWSGVIGGLEVIIFGDTTISKNYDSGFSRGDKLGRQLVVNELAGVIYVRDYSDNMENISSFLDDIEEAVKRQVLIQAHIVEVTLNDAFSMGIDWSALVGSGTGPNGELLKFSQSLVPAVPSKVFQFSVSDERVNALLDAMKDQGQVHTLSSPKIATLNNQKAVIKLTTKEVSWITNTVLNANGEVTIVYTSPQIDEVGIFLDVTPQIDDQGNIAMQIHPSISDKTGTSFSPDGQSSKPIIDTREVDTMIDIKDGQTIVIAGLIVDKIIDEKRSVPILGDLPLIGTLFSLQRQEKKKTELVIFITPYVLNKKNIDEIRREHEQRLSDAGRQLLMTP
jgi:MSHA biogenesis protein MshL